jgi:hypothetical protein
VSELALYARLALLNGLMWLVGFVAAAVDHPAVWYAFILLCGLQVMTQRILSLGWYIPKINFYVCDVVNTRAVGRSLKILANL